MMLKGGSELLLMNQEGPSPVKVSTSYFYFPNLPHMLATAGLRAVWAWVPESSVIFLSPGLYKDQILIMLGRNSKNIKNKI